MTIKEVKEMYDGEYVDVEVYEPNSRGEYYPNHFHTDNCKLTEEFTDESKVGLYELMDEEDYEHSINANSCMETDFEEWYDNKDAKVLCIMLADIDENNDESEEYTEEELKDALSEFYESCIRTGHYNMEECAKYFCRENDHMNVDEYNVLEILKRIDKN